MGTHLHDRLWKGPQALRQGESPRPYCPEGGLKGFGAAWAEGRGGSWAPGCPREVFFLFRNMKSYFRWKPRVPGGQGSPVGKASGSWFQLRL